MKCMKDNGRRKRTSQKCQGTKEMIRKKGQNREQKGRKHTSAKVRFLEITKVIGLY